MQTNPRLTDFALELFEDRVRHVYSDKPEDEINRMIADRRARVAAMGTQRVADLLLKELPSSAFHEA